MIDPFFGLLVLWALTRKGGGAAAPATSVFTSTPAATAHPATGPSAFPPVPAAAAKPPVPSPSVQAGKKWQVYDPLNQAVIARAEQLLHDPTMKPNDERIEPDPAGGGNMRYLKVRAPAGRISVTAWKPSTAPRAPVPSTTARGPVRGPMKHQLHGIHVLSG